MGKPTFTPNPRCEEIFEDLDKYLVFCQDYGYRYNEADLYNWKSYAWQQFSKYTQNKSVKNTWTEDAKRFSGRMG